MKRTDHRIMIEQPQFDLSSHWTVINLRDNYESPDRMFVSGTWTPTNISYNDRMIMWQSNMSHYEWRATAYGGDIYIGSKGTSPSSQKAGDEFWFDIHIMCYRAYRDALGRFRVRGALPNAGGFLRHTVSDSSGEHFKGGGILWSMVEYG